jgi:hypothetical protein
MEAGRCLSEQEMFYARLEGRHAALDERAGLDYAYPSLIFLYGKLASKKPLVEFIRGYNDASREISGKDRTSRIKP